MIVALVLGGALYMLSSSGALKGSLAANTIQVKYLDITPAPINSTDRKDSKQVFAFKVITGSGVVNKRVRIVFDDQEGNNYLSQSNFHYVLETRNSVNVFEGFTDLPDPNGRVGSLFLDLPLIDNDAKTYILKAYLRDNIDAEKSFKINILSAACECTVTGDWRNKSGAIISVVPAAANAAEVPAAAENTPSPQAPSPAPTPVSINVSSPANGQPAQGNIVLNSPEYTEILKVHLYSDADTDLSKVKLTLTFPDNNERFPRILSRYMLMDFQLLTRGRSTPINSGILWFQAQTEKEFLLNGVLRANQPYDLVVRAKSMFMSEADAALRPSFRLNISNYQNAANNLRVIGPDIISNRFTFVPAAAAVAPAEPVSPDVPSPIVTGEVRNINLLNPAIITVPERLTGVGDLTEILKFRITTSAPKFIKQIKFKLKNDPNMVDISKLTYALFDNTPVAGEPPVNIFASVDPNTNTLAFDYSNNILPSGHEFSLKISPKQESIGTLDGKKVTFGFENGEAILVEGTPIEFRPAVGVFALWGRTYTFSDSHAPAVVIEPEVCSAAHTCIHPIVAETIASHTFQPNENALVPVLGFTITPTQNTNVSSITVSLDNTVQDHPARGSQIKVQLLRINADGTETVLGGPWLPTYNSVDTYSFRQLGGRMLFANRPERYLVKAQVVGERQNVPQNFRLVINPEGGIVMRMFHGVSLGQNLVSNMMTIGASVPDPAIEPQNDQCAAGSHYNELVQECVADGSDSCGATQHYDVQLRICVNDEVVLEQVDAPVPAPIRDVCINIAGDQDKIPQGKMGDGVGGCIDIPVVVPEKSCTEQGKFDYSGPDRGGLTKGTCIPCPTNLFIQSNMTCFIVDSGKTKTPETAGSAETQKETNSNQNTSGVRGSAIEGVGSLGQSQRLTYVPERGNTGPDASLYLALVGLSPALAYGLKKLRK